MAQAKVEVIEGKNYRTEVYVNGKFAYQTANTIPVEKKNIKRLLALLDGEDIEGEEFTIPGHKI